MNAPNEHEVDEAVSEAALEQILLDEAQEQWVIEELRRDAEHAEQKRLSQIQSALRRMPRLMGGESIWLHGRPWGVLSGLLWTLRPSTPAVIAAVSSLLGTRYGGVDPMMWESDDWKLGQWEGDDE